MTFEFGNLDTYQNVQNEQFVRNQKAEYETRTARINVRRSIFFNRHGDGNFVSRVVKAKVKWLVHNLSAVNDTNPK